MFTLHAKCSSAPHPEKLIKAHGAKSLVSVWLKNTKIKDMKEKLHHLELSAACSLSCAYCLVIKRNTVQPTGASSGSGSEI